MGILDKVRDLVRGNKDTLKRGIDKTSDVVERKVGAKHTDKVENAAAKAKDTVDKLAGP